MNSTELNQVFVHFNEPFLISLIINITTLVFGWIGILFSLLFISIIIYNRSLHTLPNILTLNSALAILFLSSDSFSIAICVLYRDLIRQQWKVELKMKSVYLCHIRGYIAHITFCALIYSYVIQSIYRLASTIFYHQTSYHRLKIYLYAICIQWTFAVLQLLPIILGNNQIYIEYEYLCQIAIENSKAIGYICLTNYIIPLTIIMIIYFKIATSVKQRDSNGILRYNIHRARRQMVMIKRILILILILLVLGGPYSTFIIMEVFSIARAPSYAHRIGFMFIAVACGFSIITIIHFSHSTRQIIYKFLLKDRKWIREDELQSLRNNRNSELSSRRTPVGRSDNS